MRRPAGSPAAAASGTARSARTSVQPRRTDIEGIVYPV
jgi:hypothetical protein